MVACNTHLPLTWFFFLIKRKKLFSLQQSFLCIFFIEYSEEYLLKPFNMATKKKRTQTSSPTRMNVQSIWYSAPFWEYVLGIFIMYENVHRNHGFCHHGKLIVRGRSNKIKLYFYLLLLLLLIMACFFLSARICTINIHLALFLGGFTVLYIRSIIHHFKTFSKFLPVAEYLG